MLYYYFLPLVIKRRQTGQVFFQNVFQNFWDTHPVGRADSLVVDAVAFLRQQRGVPVAVVGLVVPHGEGLGRVDAAGGELSSEVVLGVQQRGVLEVNGNRVAAQDFRGASRSAWTFLLHHHLVRTANTGTQTELTDSSGPNGHSRNAVGNAGTFLFCLLPTKC